MLPISWNTSAFKTWSAFSSTPIIILEQRLNRQPTASLPNLETVYQCVFSDASSLLWLIFCSTVDWDRTTSHAIRVITKTVAKRPESR